MKRLIMILCLCMPFLGVYAQQEEFNPTNPGDPQPYYSLTVQVSPSSAGNANITRIMATEGQELALRISPNKDFVFQQWVCGEEVLSTSSYYYYTMPARNVVITAQLVYSPSSSTFDPSNPPDPEGQGELAKRHRVTIFSSPSIGGYTDMSSFYMAEGEQRNVYAYTNAGYEFMGWYNGDRLESTTNPVRLTMQDRDMSFTARFRFNPISPVDPGANYYDPSTGTLVVDRFLPNGLSDAIYNLIRYETNSIKSVTIVGEMTSSDYGAVTQFYNAEMIDLSRTTGYNAIPSWAFEGRQNLVRLLLPASVEKIGGYAFYGCTGLRELVLYSPAPPVLDEYAYDPFYGVSEELVVRVPAASLALYQASQLWNSFMLLPMDVQALNVTLPEDKVALYRNMYLELLDTKSGQLRRYVVTQRDKYSFSGIFDETTYQLTLRNAQDKVFGQEMITFVGNDTTVTFSSLLQPVDLSVRVLNDKDEDVSAHTTVTWTDGNGKYIGQGASLAGQTEGDILYYQWALDEELGVVYQKQDTAIRVVVDKDNHVIVDKLKLLPKKTIVGFVTDSISDKPINGASVVVTQLINGKYNKVYNAASANDGSFGMEIMDAPFTMAVTATNYKRRDISDTEWSNNNRIGMAELSGATISYDFRYISAVADGEEATVQNWYQNYDNVDFALFNVTKGVSISQFEVQYPRIILLEDIEDGDELRITASSLANDFMPVQTSAVITGQRAAVNFDIKELGKLRASCTKSANQKVVGSLYDANGKLVKSADFGSSSLTMSKLADGNYTLVAMSKSTLFNTIYDIKNLPATGLVAGVDYVSQAVAVESGKISIMTLGSIPVLDESKLYYTGSNTSYATSKPSVMIGNYLTFTGRIDFKAEYASSVSNVKLIMDIPDGSSFVENSVMIGNRTGGYTLSDNQVIVPVSDLSERVRFCIIPTISGSYSPSAYVRFDLNDKTITQPIGAANFSAQALSISVPSISATTTINISGSAIGKADVEIFDNGTLIGQTSSATSGKWSVKCELVNPYNLSTHSISAKIKSSNGLEFESETKDCVYDKNAVQVSKVTMYHYNPELNTTFKSVFDFLNPSTKPNRWTVYYPNKKFNYTIEFTNNSPEMIDEVILYVHTADRRVVPLYATYDEEKNCWVADIDMGNSSDGYYPVNVSVDYSANVEPVVDAEWLHNILNSYSETLDYLQEDADGLDELFLQWDAASEAGNDELDSLLLLEMQKLVGYEPSGVAPVMDEQTLQQLSAKVKLYADSLDNVMTNIINPDLYDNDIIREYMEGVTIRKAAGLDKDQLLADGFNQVAKTDSSFYYVKYDNEELHFVDFAEDLYIIAGAQSGLYAAMRTDGTLEVNWVEKLNNLSETIYSLLDIIRTTLDDVVERLADATASAQVHYDLVSELYRTRELDHLTKSEISYLRKQMLQDMKIINRNTKLNNWIKKYLGQFMSGSTEVSKKIGKGFSIFSAVMNAKEGIDRYMSLLYLRNSVYAPCDEAVSAASELKSSIGTFMNYTGAYYVTKAVSNIAQITGISGGIAALIPSGGTSTSAILGAFAIMAANVAADWIWNWTYNSKYSDFNNIYRNLYTYCNKKPCDGQVPCPPPHDDDDDDGGGGGDDPGGGGGGDNPGGGGDNPGGGGDNPGGGGDNPGGDPGSNPGGDPGGNPGGDPGGGDDPGGDPGGNPGSSEGGGTTSGSPDDDVQIDPSGFVYEAIANNRVEGVQATIYYKDTHENMFGEQVEEEILWDASEYGQENPLYTDSRGMYRWDVPQGLWQVRFEKDGYEPTQSEWLPVPPPQLEVNIPIIQLRQPEVANAVARKDAIDITFDKFMMPNLLNTDNIFVTANEQKIEGTITFLDEQKAYGDNAPSYVSKVRFVPDAEFNAPQITLTVSNRVHSYADVPMAQTFQQVFDVENASVMQQAEAIIASIPTGSAVKPGTELTLTCATEGAVIRYTLDGSTPNCLSGLEYKQPIVLYGSKQVLVKAIACADGYYPSQMIQNVYLLDESITSVEQTQSAAAHAVKLLRDGHIYILMPDGRKYTILGSEIR